MRLIFANDQMGRNLRDKFLKNIILKNMKTIFYEKNLS